MVVTQIALFDIILCTQILTLFKVYVSYIIIFCNNNNILDKKKNKFL
jgi:hypothetical protein